MRSVNNEAEHFESVAVAAAWEHVATVCSVWASVEAQLALQIKLTTWTCKARRRCAPAPEMLQNEGPSFSSAKRAFSTRSSIEETAQALVSSIGGADHRRRPVRFLINTP